MVVFIGLISSKALAAVLAYLAMYSAAKVPEHTLITLAELEQKIKDYMIKGLVFQEFSKSDLDFPKYHVLVHLLFFIKKYGRLQNLDTESNEQFHHFSAQLPYQHASKHPEKLAERMAGFVERQDNGSFLDSQMTTASEDSDSDEEVTAPTPEERLPRLLNRGAKVTITEIKTQYLPFLSSVPQALQALEQRRSSTCAWVPFVVHLSAKLSSGKFLRIKAPPHLPCCEVMLKDKKTYVRVLLLFSLGKVEMVLASVFSHDDLPQHAQVTQAGLTPLRATETCVVFRLTCVLKMVHVVPNFTAANKTSFLLNHFVS